MKRYSNALPLLLMITLLSFGTQSNLNAQESNYKKNSVFVSYGTAIFHGQCAIAAERTVYEKDRLRYKVKLNYGKYSKNDSELSIGPRNYKAYYGASGVLVLGLFEFSLGVARIELMDSRTEPKLRFQSNTGIRYEKNEFLVRAGLGNRELLYVGIGLNF